VSEPYHPDNLLNRRTAQATLEFAYRHQEQRERELLARHLRITGGDALSVGCGWHPGRHLLPAPDYRLVVADIDGDCVASALASGAADAGVVARAGELGLESRSFDVVLYRLVLHHAAFQGPLAPIFDEATRLLRPGGALVAIEPGLWHPIGLALALANRARLGTAVHGTPDDVPLSPRALCAHARAAGLRPALFAVTYSWRRLAPRAQRALWWLERFGETPVLRSGGHTLLLIARA